MFQKITDHVYWMTPDKPDRPSLAAVVGERHTLMLEGGASAAHARLFLEALAGAGIRPPRYTALTHWHWDHVFGAAESGVPVIAHAETAERLKILAGYDWSDAALDQRVAAGEEVESCARDIRLELPAPRAVTIALPEIIFRDALEIDLGGVTCRLQHVGGDHARDSCVAYILPDRLLFLGDCLYEAIYAPARHLSTRRVFALLDKLDKFDAAAYIEGHNPALMDRPAFEAYMGKMRAAGILVNRIGANERAVMAAARVQPAFDEEMEDLLRAFLAGL
jgi:glyoxylase-like metal-dependent hydrolase (beta-lactamase superfamily II)